MNDYEAHLSSYDHSHRQRLKDMKSMVRDPNAGARARRAEAKADGLVPMKMAEQESLGSSTAGGGGGCFKKGGFKKSGFKNAFAPVDDPSPSQPPPPPTNSLPRAPEPSDNHGSLVESDTEDEGYEVYDPRFPTE
jgi:hypothetical protein